MTGTIHSVAAIALYRWGHIEVSRRIVFSVLARKIASFASSTAWLRNASFHLEARKHLSLAILSILWSILVRIDWSHILSYVGVEVGGQRPKLIFTILTLVHSYLGHVRPSR